MVQLAKEGGMFYCKGDSARSKAIRFYQKITLSREHLDEAS
jgi:hypothetical protein